MTPGIHDIPLAEYLADPAPEPSLSAGVAHTLLTRSPLHAWHKRKRDQVYARDAALGTVFHRLFLGKGGEYAVIEADDFRTKAAREAREEAMANGQTPIKAADFAIAELMLEAAATQLDAHEIGNPTNEPGKSEQALVWQEPGGVWCRAMIDRLPDDYHAIYDVKTTTCAHPGVWRRRAFEMGFDLTAAHYTRGAHQVLGVRPAYRFIVVENAPPYALSVVDLSPATLHMAERKRAAAVKLWGECVRTNRWPAYPSRTCTIETPPYLEAQWTEGELAGHYEPAMLDQLLEGFAA